MSKRETDNIEQRLMRKAVNEKEARTGLLCVSGGRRNFHRMTLSEEPLMGDASQCHVKGVRVISLQNLTQGK